MTGIILAGGKASRMGGACDKALLPVGAEPMIVRQLKVLRKIVPTIIIVSNNPENLPAIGDARVVADILPGKGPLGGLHAGLSASFSRENFVIACDMPFVDEALVRHMIAQDGFDIVVPRIDGSFHPLFGTYSRDCLATITEQIAQGDLRVSSLFSKVRTRFLSKEELATFDAGFKALTNVNTPEDWAAARQAAEAAVPKGAYRCTR